VRRLSKQTEVALLSWGLDRMGTRFSKVPVICRGVENEKVGEKLITARTYFYKITKFEYEE
jgi:hypothetical protein